MCKIWISNVIYQIVKVYILSVYRRLILRNVGLIFRIRLPLSSQTFTFGSTRRSCRIHQQRQLQQQNGYFLRFNAQEACHLRQEEGLKEKAKEPEAYIEDTKSNHVVRKLRQRQQDCKIDPHFEEQFAGGRLLAAISSRPLQCGRADGYILEGKELEFYVKKIQRKKGKGASGAA
ncbi:unnamed protein product [Coffea canephora]|uniref:40S ribosomal protein S8 n=1 Tax=Coffea canephora TaxID=49390 RepID=A0A068UZD1_COFCA|nr:unnamed protein product [Coffea canephora]